jgi:hypothetical protein
MKVPRSRADGVSNYRNNVYFIAINAAVGHPTGDDRVVSFKPDKCSITILETHGISLNFVKRGDDADHLVCLSVRVQGFIAAAVIVAIDETFNAICDDIANSYELIYAVLCRRLPKLLSITNQSYQQLIVIINKLNFLQIAQFLHLQETTYPKIE